MFYPNDVYMGRMLAAFGEYSQEETDLYSQLIRPGDVVIEAGANIGCFTVPLAKIVGPSGAVLAFEPQRALYYLLCGNLALNGLHATVHAIHAAVGAERGSIKVPSLDYSTEANFGGLSLGGVVGEEVPIVTIDGMQFPKLRMIKADVEGMEAEVLLGAKDTIARHRPLLYVENDREEKSERLIGIMRGMGYRLFRHHPRYLPTGNGMFPNMVSINVLAIPNEISIASITLNEF